MSELRNLRNIVRYAILESHSNHIAKAALLNEDDPKTVYQTGWDAARWGTFLEAAGLIAGMVSIFKFGKSGWFARGGWTGSAGAWFLAEGAANIGAGIAYWMVSNEMTDTQEKHFYRWYSTILIGVGIAGSVTGVYGLSKSSGQQIMKDIAAMHVAHKTVNIIVQDKTIFTIWKNQVKQLDGIIQRRVANLIAEETTDNIVNAILLSFKYIKSGAIPDGADVRFYALVKSMENAMSDSGPVLKDMASMRQTWNQHQATVGMVGDETKIITREQAKAIASRVNAEAGEIAVTPAQLKDSFLDSQIAGNLDLPTENISISPGFSQRLEEMDSSPLSASEKKLLARKKRHNMKFDTPMRNVNPAYIEYTISRAIEKIKSLRGVDKEQFKMGWQQIRENVIGVRFNRTLVVGSESTDVAFEIVGFTITGQGIAIKSSSAKAAKASASKLAKQAAANKRSLNADRRLFAQNGVDGSVEIEGFPSASRVKVEALDPGTKRQRPTWTLTTEDGIQIGTIKGSKGNIDKLVARYNKSVDKAIEITSEYSKNLAPNMILVDVFSMPNFKSIAQDAIKTPAGRVALRNMLVLRKNATVFKGSFWKTTGNYLLSFLTGTNAYIRFFRPFVIDFLAQTGSQLSTAAGVWDMFGILAPGYERLGGKIDVDKVITTENSEMTIDENEIIVPIDILCDDPLFSEGIPEEECGIR